MEITFSHEKNINKYKNFFIKNLIKKIPKTLFVSGDQEMVII